MKNDLIKKPNEQLEFSPDQIQELQRCAADPIYFIRNYVKIQHPKHGSIMFDMFEYQERAIRAFQENRFTIVKIGRQMGKTTIIATYLLWYACFRFDKIVLVASNKNSNAIEIMDRIKYAYEELPMWLKPGCVYYNRHSIEFDNGSKIVSQATSPNTGRGMAVSLLMLDELAFVPRRIQDEMWTSIAPTLSTGGSCLVSSTPNGDSDLFAQLWRGAVCGEDEETDFFPVEVEWDEHPDRDEKFKKTMMSKVGELMWRQEFCCEFISSDPLLINSLVLARLTKRPPLYEDMGFKFWGKPVAGRQYLVGVDVATGVGNDFSVIQVFEFPSLIQVAEFRSNKVGLPQFFTKLKWILNKFCRDENGTPIEVSWTFESNGPGAAIAAMYYNDEKFPEVTLVSDDGKCGMVTTNKNKVQECLEFKRLVEKTAGGMTINSEILLFEMANFVANKASFTAKSGATDDAIMATMMVIRMIKKMSEYEPEMFHALYSDDAHEEEVEDADPMPFTMF